MNLQPGIKWTSSVEQYDRPATDDETRAMKDRAVEAMVALGKHLDLRRRVIEKLTAQEEQLRLRVKSALDQASTSTVRSAALIGYDLDAGETLLADPKTFVVLARRPMTDAERYAAEQMPIAH